MNKYEFKDMIAAKGIPTEGNHVIWFNDQEGSTSMEVWKNISVQMANIKAGKCRVAYVYPNGETMCNIFENGKFIHSVI